MTEVVKVVYADNNAYEYPEPTREFEVPTGGELQLTMADGSVFVITNSEWSTVYFYAAPINIRA